MMKKIIEKISTNIPISFIKTGFCQNCKIFLIIGIQETLMLVKEIFKPFSTIYQIETLKDNEYNLEIKF